ncbi:ABC transporter permease [Novosphingobium mangrovi (ex Huang et al. 2023)]|uniref:ABC transporter permease n=1 Tax=Novosphingobium mangrovi (ex Huang et al. 2023) TaxID=2976432 RepID=A0ABT2I431_9SPHN|nr:ABC transporter permease [Novosphingobium mangrovi (ex Huang et al. 2023)]MCT2399564.1 ABC transporter permease [Novosphingobium mangrovi (ex Huang et al. 2023)]
MEAIIDTLAKIFSLCRKEVIALLKDPANRVILIGPALVQSLLFGYAATFDLKHVPYAVFDQSHSAASTEFLARLDGTGIFEREATLTTSQQIAPVIRDGRALMAVSFPADFASDLSAGREAKVQVIFDGRNSTTAGAAAGYVNTVIAAYNRERGAAAPVVVERRAWFNPNLDSRWQILPAMIATLSMLQTLLLAALSVAREREQGTFDQLLVTPLTPLQILVGKAVPSVLVGLTQSTIILMITRFWFHIPMEGSVWLLYLGLLGFTSASVGIGMSISALALNMQQAMLYTFFIILPLALLSGLITPVRNMPEVLQIATYANPLRFGVDLVRRIYLEGAGLGDIAHDFLPLLVVASVTMPLAAWLFRNRLA